MHKICIFDVSSLSRMRKFVLLLLIKGTLKLIHMNFTLFFIHLFPFSSCSYSLISLFVRTGFSRKKQYDTAAQFIYHRAAARKNNSPVGVSTAKPIVFVHGIGKRYLLIILFSIILNY